MRLRSQRYALVQACGRTRVRRCQKVMEETLTRAWNDLLARDSGPFHFRLFLQPLVATILAIRAGWADAGEGRPIFFWTLARDPAQIAIMLRNLWRIAGKVFLVAVALDIVYQLIVL